MIVYRLQCADGHEFDAWFRDSAAFDALAKAKQVSCAECGSMSVSKALMAPNLAKGAKQPPSAPVPIPSESKGEDSPAEIKSKMDALARKLRRHVKDNFDYVGESFASEVRKIHDGEAEERGVYGEAKPEEVQELVEDGIDVLPLPGTPEKAN